MPYEAPHHSLPQQPPWQRLGRRGKTGAGLRHPLSQWAFLAAWQPSWRPGTDHRRGRGCGGGDGLECNEVCTGPSGPTNLRTHTCNSTHLCVQLPRVGGERWSVPRSPPSGPLVCSPARRSRLSSRTRLQRRSVTSHTRLHARYFTRAQPITPITCTCFFRGHGEGVAHRLFRMSPAQWLRGPTWTSDFDMHHQYPNHSFEHTRFRSHLNRQSFSCPQLVVSSLLNCC